LQSGVQGPVGQISLWPLQNAQNHVVIGNQYSGGLLLQVS
jgi:hypothetical protein